MRAPSRRSGGLARALVLSIAAPCLAASAQTNDNPDYTLSVGNAVTAPGAAVDVPVFLDNEGTSVQGWSFGICFDESEIIVGPIEPGSATQTVKAGGPPDFIQFNPEPGGWTMGVVICFTACATMPQGTDYELAVAEYAALAPAGSNISLCPCATLGTPVINAVVVVNGQSIPPVKECGNVQVQPLVPFTRADTNADGFLDLSDAIWLLNHLFQGGPKFECDEMNDANDDGSLDTADPVYVVLYYFAGGEPPPHPYPNCGLVTNQDIDDCEVFPACP